MLIDGNKLKQEDHSVNPLFKVRFENYPEPSESIEIKGRGKYTPRNKLNNLTGTEWIKSTRSWFEHHPPPRNKELNEHLHPAKYPEDLVERFINFFTKQNMWVLDPFLGTGSTLVACDSAKRNGIGVELTQKWCKIASKRKEQYIIKGDCRNIPDYGLPLIDFCISSPPYWDMLHHSRGGSDSTQKERISEGFDAVFSEHDQDLGNIVPYEEFMEELLDIYEGILKVMRPGKYCAVIMQNTLKSGQKFYPVAWEFALKMRDRGWKLCQEYLWCQRDKKLGIWGYPNTYISNVHHHYVLIFRKPKPKKSKK